MARQRARFYNDSQCKGIAATIKAQMKDHEPATLNYTRLRVDDAGNLIYPFVPIWGPDIETVSEKVNRLFHPKEAAVILEHLTA